MANFDIFFDQFGQFQFVLRHLLLFFSPFWKPLSRKNLANPDRHPLEDEANYSVYPFSTLCFFLSLSLSSYHGGEDRSV
jgi:hypothetical protein